MSIPIFLGTSNSMVPLPLTSYGRHLGFPYGGHLGFLSTFVLYLGNVQYTIGTVSLLSQINALKCDIILLGTLEHKLIHLEIYHIGK